MKKKWIYLLTALALAVGVCGAKPIVSGAAPTEPVNLEEKIGSMKIYPESPKKEASQKFGDDLLGANVVVDVYKVANAVKTPGQDTYSYDFGGQFDNTTIAKPTADQPYTMAVQWEILAQDVAQEILNKKVTALATGKIELGKEYAELDEKLEAGLYLIIARGEDLKDISDYKVDLGEGEYMMEGTTVPMPDTIATMARSAQYTYLFTPELISLPMRDTVVDNGGNYNTADGNAWVYDLEVYLKPQRLQQYGSMEIEKTISLYEQELRKDGTVIEEPVTAVFRVAWQIEDPANPGQMKEESRVTSLTFDAAGVKKETLNRIPAGVPITVTEVYQGAGYEIVGSTEQKGVIRTDVIKNVRAVRGADGTVKYLEGDIVTPGGFVPENQTEIGPAEFENRHNDEQKKGYGIRNQFTYNATTNTWEWSLPDWGEEDDRNTATNTVRPGPIAQGLPSGTGTVPGV